MEVAMKLRAYNRRHVAIANHLDYGYVLMKLAIVAISLLFVLAAIGGLLNTLAAAPLPVVEVAAVSARPDMDAGPPSPAPAAAAGCADARPLLIDGEKLDFDIYYGSFCGSIPAGSATLEVTSGATPDGAVYRITSEARSNDLVSVFFNVDDHVVSEVDAATYEPKHYEKSISEGSLKKHVTIEYGSDGSVQAGDETFRVEPGTRDILSALYYVRGQDLRVGEDVIVRTFENGKCYQARVRVLGREKVSTHRGNYECLVVEPQIVEGIFAKAGKLVIYLTDDALKLPVLVKSKVKIGSFVAELAGRDQ
jgi:Protein of unknown function (DUF3108)